MDLGTLLALLAALAFGSAQFLNGAIAARTSGLTVARWSLCSAAAVSCVFALTLGPGLPSGGVLWAVVAGLGGALASAALYRALEHGEVSVVIPMCTVVGISLPVGVGFLALGEPVTASTVIGLGAALGAIVLVTGSRHRPTTHGDEDAAVVSPPVAEVLRDAVGPQDSVGPQEAEGAARADGGAGGEAARVDGDLPVHALATVPGRVAGTSVSVGPEALAASDPATAHDPSSVPRTVGPDPTPPRRRLLGTLAALGLPVLAGVGIAIELVGISSLPGDGFFTLLAIAFTAGAAVLLSMRTAPRVPLRPAQRATVVVAGGLTAMGTALFHLAAGRIGLGLSGILMGLYPVIPIVLAVLLLGERPGRVRLVGLALSAAAVLVISTG